MSCNKLSDTLESEADILNTILFYYESNFNLDAYVSKQNRVNCTLQNPDIVTNSPLHPLSSTGIFRLVFVEDTYSHQVYLNVLQNDFPFSWS
jgi:hypothetical protein